jgi:uncharacterized protein
VAGLYDLERLKEGLLAEGDRFSVFGGEPLLMPLDDLRELVAWGFEHFGGSGIQTNGTLITDDHLDIFRTYNVQVGISVDGPGDLNDVRRRGDVDRTRRMTERTLAAVRRLCDEGMTPSVIITLHRGNASPAKLPRLVAWIEELDAMGVQHARLHLLEAEDAAIAARWGLAADENIAALRAFKRLEPTLVALRFDIFADMRNLLQGRDSQATCVWKACDPYTTHAVRGVEGDGQRTNCGRTNKDGIDFRKADEQGFERYVALYHTPQDAGGCQGCRFFLMCKGQCPGTAIDQDWRNRTDHCEVWKALYAELEAEMVTQGIEVMSQSPERAHLEHEMLAAWSEGRQTTMEAVRTGGAGERHWRQSLRDLRRLVVE